ncbi:hypothetical protein BC940DRAFT_303740 [Gongronella butleri]|nr:hypothetical protein BC940DRAFT_303740 [Gongronella butleri]
MAATTYWYSTDGLDRKRLSDRHVPFLDEAFLQQKRVEIYDPDAFGDTVALACPHLGTMTAGDIHYGLYRQPSLWQPEDDGLDCMLFDDERSTSLAVPQHKRASDAATTVLHHHRRHPWFVDHYCCIIS